MKSLHCTIERKTTFNVFKNIQCNGLLVQQQRGRIRKMLNRNTQQSYESFPVTTKKVRKKRRSKYDVSKIYEGSSTQPFFLYQPGQSRFYNHENELTHDPSLNLRPQKDRTVFSDEQMFILERAYQRDKHPGPDVRQLIADLTALSAERVRIWYQNRRAKEKRDQEDELAYLAEKMRNETCAYSTQQYPRRSTLNQKLDELNRIFSHDAPHSNHSNMETSTPYRSSEPSFHRQPRSHNRSSERDVVKQLLRQSSSSTSTHTKQRAHSSSTEYSAVRELLLQSSKKEPKLPTIETFTKRKHRAVSTSDEERSKERTRRHQDKFGTKKRAFREEKDMDEARCIQDLMKRCGGTSSNKKSRHENNSSSSKEYHSKTTCQPNNKEEELSTINMSHIQNNLESIDHTRHNESGADLNTGVAASNTPPPTTDVNGLANFFTANQLHVLQLLNQRSILEQFQRLCSTSGVEQATQNLQNISSQHTSIESPAHAKQEEANETTSLKNESRSFM